MPIYDLECRHCGHAEEAFQMMFAPQPSACPECKWNSLIRVILKAPAIRTDCSFFMGTGDGLPNSEPLRRLYHQNAEASGISTAGKRYMPELVRPGMQCGRDPEAWVPEMEGGSYVRKILQKRRWSSNDDSRVVVKAPPSDTPDEKKAYRPAPDIVRRAVRQQIKKDKLVLTPSEHRQLVQQTSKSLAGKMGE